MTSQDRRDLASDLRALQLLFHATRDNYVRGTIPWAYNDGRLAAVRWLRESIEAGQLPEEPEPARHE